MIRRREFLAALSAVGMGAFPVRCAHSAVTGQGVHVADIAPGEDLFAYILRTRGAFDAELYKQLLGAANEFKEGDGIVGVAAADETSRMRARRLLAATRVIEIERHPVLEDDLYAVAQAARDPVDGERFGDTKLGELKAFLLIESCATNEPGATRRELRSTRLRVASPGAFTMQTSISKTKRRSRPG